MSRIGKKTILIPAGVEVKLEDVKIIVQGPKGILSRDIRPEIGMEIKEGKVLVFPKMETKKTNAFWGLTRILIFNMIEGVTKGFEKKLQIEGLGFRAAMEGQDLALQIGYSHPVKVKAPEGIKFSVEKNIISVSGIDKEKLGEITAKIRDLKKPEPYKGKGIRYLGEVVRKKMGKKAAVSAK